MHDPYCTIQLTEAERELLLLAIGNLAIDQPMFAPPLGELAERLDGRVVFESFKDLRRDEYFVSELRWAYQGSALPGPGRDG